MKLVRICLYLFTTLMLLLTSSVYAEEVEQVINSGGTSELEGISVIGNRELPKALVIVPWKAPEPGDLGGSPLQSLIDEVLAPIDRDVHKRKVSYYEQYY